MSQTATTSPAKPASTGAGGVVAAPAQAVAPQATRPVARLNPDQQALVKAGQIAVGFDMDTVKLALGDPDHILMETNASGQHEIWRYVTYEDYQGVVIYGGYWHRYRGWGGPGFWGGEPYYNGYPARVHERIRVIFDTTGHVAVIQQDKP